MRVLAITMGILTALMSVAVSAETRIDWERDSFDCEIYINQMYETDRRSIPRNEVFIQVDFEVRSNVIDLASHNLVAEKIGFYFESEGSSGTSHQIRSGVQVTEDGEEVFVKAGKITYQRYHSPGDPPRDVVYSSGIRAFKPYVLVTDEFAQTGRIWLRNNGANFDFRENWYGQPKYHEDIPGGQITYLDQSAPAPVNEVAQECRRERS